MTNKQSTALPKKKFQSLKVTPTIEKCFMKMKLSCCTGFQWDTCGVGLGLHAPPKFGFSKENGHPNLISCPQTLMLMWHQELCGTEWFSSHLLSLCYLKSGNLLHVRQDNPIEGGDYGDSLGKDLNWPTALKMGREKWGEKNGEMKTVLTMRVTGHQSQRILLMYHYHTAPLQHRLLIEIFLVTFPYFFLPLSKQLLAVPIKRLSPALLTPSCSIHKPVTSK